jgi:hypothetical protein
VTRSTTGRARPGPARATPPWSCSPGRQLLVCYAGPDDAAATAAIAPLLAIDGVTGSSVEPDATAVAYRDSEVLVISAAFFPPDAPDEAVAAYNAEWATLLPHVQGLYGNFSALASDEATPLMYPSETLRRLREVKAAYDPGNLFDQNHKVRPSAPDWS